MPSKSGPIRPKRAGKKAGMSLEEVLKIEKIRSSAPLQIMDGLKAQRGRPKRHWPNPVTRLNPYEDVPMVVNPQTTAEPQDEPHRSKPKEDYPPLKIVMDGPEAKRPKREVPLPTFYQKPKRTKLVHCTDAGPRASSSTRTGHSLRHPQHVHVSHGYSYEDLRQASRSPSDESLSSISTSTGSYPSTPLSAHSYHAAPGLMSSPTFYHSPSELNNSIGVPSMTSMSLPPVTSSTSTAWQTLPTLHELDYGRIETPSWTWNSHQFYPQTYPPGYTPY
ncbi:hypothetical protein TWF281_002584 [Arthrobotrys megalospora]